MILGALRLHFRCHVDVILGSLGFWKTGERDLSDRALLQILYCVARFDDELLHIRVIVCCFEAIILRPFGFSIVVKKGDLKK